MHLPIIRIERIPLLQVYFSYLQNKAQYLKIFVLNKVLNFVLLVPHWSYLLWTCKLVIWKTDTMRELFYYYYYYLL